MSDQDIDSFTHDGTEYSARRCHWPDEYLVTADTNTKNGKLMRLKLAITRSELQNDSANQSDVRKALRIGHERLRPQVLAKLDEIGERDMIQEHFADDAIDAAILANALRYKRQEEAANKAREEKEAADSADKQILEDIPGWGMF